MESCKTRELSCNEYNKLKDALSHENNCINFVHPVWIDEVTFLDTTIENYNSVVLRSYVKNNCCDTISIGMWSYRLYTEYIMWYYQDESGPEFIDTRPDSLHILAPGDSIYVYIIDENSKYINKIDSMKVAVNYRVKGQRVDKLVKIDKKDFVFIK